MPNIVLQDMPGGAWQATTKVDVKAYTQYQQAGLIVYTDDDNYAKFVVQGRTSNQADRIFQYAHEVAASPSESNSKALGLALPDTVYLRITSDGTNMLPSYSTDGTTWIDADLRPGPTGRRSTRRQPRWAHIRRSVWCPSPIRSGPSPMPRSTASP